jgi:hypothetical protein
MVAASLTSMENATSFSAESNWIQSNPNLDDKRRQTHSSNARRGNETTSLLHALASPFTCVTSTAIRRWEVEESAVFVRVHRSHYVTSTYKFVKCPSRRKPAFLYNDSRSNYRTSTVIPEIVFSVVFPLLHDEHKELSLKLFMSLRKLKATVFTVFDSKNVQHFELISLFFSGWNNLSALIITVAFKISTVEPLITDTLINGHLQ